MGVYLPRHLRICKYVINMVLKTAYFNKLEEQVAQSQHHFDRSQKESILSTVLDVTGNIVYSNTWLGTTIIIFVINQICSTQGHVGLTVHNVVMLIKFIKEIASSFAKITNG